MSDIKDYIETLPEKLIMVFDGKPVDKKNAQEVILRTLDISKILYEKPLQYLLDGITLDSKEINYSHIAKVYGILPLNIISNYIFETIYRGYISNIWCLFDGSINGRVQLNKNSVLSAYHELKILAKSFPFLDIECYVTDEWIEVDSSCVSYMMFEVKNGDVIFHPDHRDENFYHILKIRNMKNTFIDSNELKEVMKRVKNKIKKEKIKNIL